MANEVRGQIPADFDGGRINLVLSTGAMCSLEAEEKRRAWAEVREFGKPPELVEPRKLGWKTAYPREAKACAIQSNSVTSCECGPPCGRTIAGKFLPSEPGGNVR